MAPLPCTSLARLAAVGCWAALLVSACGRGDAHGQDSTETPVVSDAASVLAGVEDVRRIAEFNGLTVSASGDHTRPSHFAHDEVPEPCRPSYQEDVAFGTGWTQFRSAVYVGTTHTSPGEAHQMVDIVQDAGVYPDAAAARAAFDRIASSLAVCESLHAPGHEITLDNTDHSALVVEGRWGSAYRVKSNVLVEVSVVGLPDGSRVASEVARNMIGRVG
jgi:PknH-like extracellular domain